jgi:hypothetical protein
MASPTGLKVTLPPHSAWTATPVYAPPGQPVVFGLRRPPLGQAANDLMYTVPLAQANRLDLVSQIFFGSPDYGWAIADVTQLVDPLLVPVGTVLRIPAASRLPS